MPVKQWKQLQQGEPVTLADGTVVTRDMVTGPARPGISLLYATDTRPVDAIARLGRGTDLMLLEGMYGSDDKRQQALKNHHMLFSEAAALAREAGTKRLLLTHFSNSEEDPEQDIDTARQSFADTAPASDLLTLTLDYPPEV